ncbi:hypothetical protein GCM10010402_05890 [Actinomadura luteofluorescens]|uniref:DUF6406 domain-containing protein n=1 Tax=Actinomadura luteofluorescens TaxID=46163 RepID=UPI002164406E|nr:DUF6406 domain-containing protein [Actinomadura glauciflava]MCR3740750.1 hypothetical protein [Actinomadura glauciflava]
MAYEEIGIQHGTQAHLGAGLKMAIFNIREGRDDAPPEVVVAVKDDGEHKFRLNPGDVFPVGDQTWRLERVVDSGGDMPGAVFARIE